MTRCSQCQTFVADDMAFCTNCGQPLEFETVVRPAVSFEIVEPPVDHTALKVAGAFVFLALFGTGLYLAGRGEFSPPIDKVVFVTATPTPTPRTPEPTPQVAEAAKPKPTPKADDEKPNMDSVMKAENPERYKEIVRKQLEFERRKQIERNMANANRAMRNAMPIANRYY